jgi:hypothetical protein
VNTPIHIVLRYRFRHRPLTSNTVSTAPGNHFTVMDTSPTGSSDCLRQAIDDEINSSEESTRALKSRHNTLAFISRLPPETLAAIFSFLSPSAWDQEAGHLAQICVAHVCCQWHETALNHPCLWSHINFTNLMPAGVTVPSTLGLPPLDRRRCQPRG